MLGIQIVPQCVSGKCDTFFQLQSFRWTYSVSWGNCLVPLEANQIALHSVWMRSNPNLSENLDPW